MKMLVNIEIFLFLLFIMSCNNPNAVIPVTKTASITSEVKKSSKLSHKFKYKQSSITNLTYTSGNQHTGKMLYVVPKVMEVRKTYQILIRISNSCVNIYEDIDSTNKLNFVHTTDAMQVKLVDPSPLDNKEFSIVDDNDAIQVVDSTDSYTEWSWDITPLRAGKGEIRAIVSNITDGEAKDMLYSEEVEVKINVLTQLMYWLNTYWQWFFATLLAPLVKFAYDKITEPKKNKKHTKHEKLD